MAEITILSDKWLSTLWFLLFIIGFNGYTESLSGIVLIPILWFLFKAMDYFFLGSKKLLRFVKIVTILAIIFRSGSYGSFLNPLWIFNWGNQIILEFQYLFFGNFEQVRALIVTGNLFFFLIFKEQIMKDKIGNRFTLLATFAGGSILLALSMIQDISFSLITIGFVFLGILKMVLDNMEKSKLKIDSDRFTVTMGICIFLVILLIWTVSSPITLAQEFESLRIRFDGGFSNIGSGGQGGLPRLTGYISNDLILGGPVEESERPTLRMISDAPIYLRGESKYVYTGTGWTDDIISRQTVPSSEIPMNQYPNVDYDELNISIEVLNGTYPVIFSGLRTTQVNTSRDNNFIALVNENDLLINFQITRGDKYDLVVEKPRYTEDVLRAGGNYRSDFPLDLYTDLPEDFPESVRELAEEITEPYTNHYDKAVAIESYLRSREFAYSLEVEHTPQGVDFVEHFLNEKEGYCVHFSTAFVVMARSVGIPTRWVKGFTSGTRSTEYEYIIHDKNAHAWAEVYLPQAGWVTFEATPGFRRRQVSSGDENPDQDPSEPTEEIDDPDRELPIDETEGGTGIGDVSEEDSSRGVRYLIASTLLMLILVTSFYIYHKRKSKTLTPKEKLVLLYNKVLGKLRVLGLGRKVGETPREFLGRLGSIKKIPLNALANLTDVFESVYYGNNIIDEEEFNKVKKKQKRLPYIKLIINRLKK